MSQFTGGKIRLSSDFTCLWQITKDYLVKSLEMSFILLKKNLAIHGFATFIFVSLIDHEYCNSNKDCIQNILSCSCVATHPSAFLSQDLLHSHLHLLCVCVCLGFCIADLAPSVGRRSSQTKLDATAPLVVETILDRSNRTCFGALKNHRGLLIAADRRHITKKYLEFDNPIEHNITRFVSLDLTKKQPYPGSPAKHFTLFCTQPKQKLTCEILW